LQNIFSFAIEVVSIPIALWERGNTCRLPGLHNFFAFYFFPSKVPAWPPWTIGVIGFDYKKFGEIIALESILLEAYYQIMR
jgi:hypothetical protein